MRTLRPQRATHRRRCRHIAPAAHVIGVTDDTRPMNKEAYLAAAATPLQEPTLRPPLADPGRHRRRPAPGGPRRHHRQRRAALGPTRPRLLRRRPPVGHHRLRPGVRQPPAARRPDRGPIRPQADLHRRPPGVCRSLRSRRGRTELRAPGRRPCPAGRLRGAAGARLAVATGNDVHGSRRARQGIRHIRGDRRHGRGDRPAARWRAHRGARLALVPLHLDPVRGPGRRRRHAAPATRPDRGPAAARPPGCVDRLLGPVLARLRPHPGGVRRLGRSAHDLLPGRKRRPPGAVRSAPAPCREPAPAVGSGHRPQPRRLVPGDRDRRRQPLRDLPVPHLLSPGHEGPERIRDGPLHSCR